MEVFLSPGNESRRIKVVPCNETRSCFRDVGCFWLRFWIGPRAPGLASGTRASRIASGQQSAKPNANILFHLPGNIRTTPRPAAIHYQPLLLNCTFTTCSFLYIFGPYLSAFTALRSFYPQPLLLPDNEASNHDGPRGGNSAEEQGERCLQGPGLGYGCRVLYKSNRYL